MKDPIKTITGLGLGGLFVLFAMHGTAFFKSAVSAWDFLLIISAKAPLGVASFFLAIAAGTLVWLALRSWLSETRNPHRRAIIIDLLAIGAGAGVAYLQLRTTQGLLFGILAGLLAPHVARGCMALSTWAGNAITDRKDAAP